MSKDRMQFKIAIPTEMKRWLAIEAARNMRSQSAEILVAIRERMERQTAATGEKFGDLAPAAAGNHTDVPASV